MKFLMYHYLKLLTKRRRRVFFNEYSIDFEVPGLAEKTIIDFKQLYHLTKEQPLPISFAFIAGFKPMMKALAHKHFAFSPIGMIHLTAEFNQHYPIDFTVPYSVTIKVKQNRRHPLGKLVQIEEQFYQNNQNCLTIKNTLLKKLKSLATPRKVEGLQFTQPAEIGIDQATARSYAKLSYDYNPIHISNRLAKLFGMPSAVIHGMHLAHLLLIDKQLNEPRLKIEFKKPCTMPSSIGFEQQNQQYQVFSGRTNLHLNCKILEQKL